MKKFVLLLISLTMLISVFLVSACGKTDEGGTSANVVKHRRKFVKWKNFA